MILEVAILDVKPAQVAEFEAAFEMARSILRASPGYVSHELQRRVEKPGRYVLLVRWRSLEDHVEGFRKSAGYQEWKRLLHHFYDPFPTVEHFEPIAPGVPGRVVEFFFSPGSRYSYLAASQMNALEADTGCRVEWRPVNGSDIRKLRGRDPFAGAAVSGQYEWEYRRRDAELWARVYGIPFREPPDHDFDFDLLARAAVAARRLGGAAAYGSALCSAVYGSDAWPIDRGVCRRIAERCGLPVAAFDVALEADETRRELANAAAEAHRRGAFGVPTFFVGEQMLWGNDRLALLRSILLEDRARVMQRALAIALACAAAWSNARLLFLSAGRSDLPGFRTYAALWAIFLVASASATPPDLLRERLSPGPGARESRFVAVLVAACVWSTHLFVAGADVGWLHMSDSVPGPLRVTGFVVLTACFVLVVWATRSNPFFSSVIRIQVERGHRVVSSGPYRFVRHPGYAAVIGIALASGLALGSWASLLPSGLVIPLLLGRIRKEEAVLRRELPGYEDYARSVPHRLLPGVW